MIKYFLFLMLLFTAIINCTQREEKIVTQHFFGEKNLPKDILKIYLNKASLNEIENGVDSFEVRKWFPFYYVDSFPLTLERFYFQKGVFKAECYFFSDMDGGLITTKKELKGLQVEKYSINNVPLNFLDSIITKYNLATMDTFDLNLIWKKNVNPYSTVTHRRIFLEQVNPRDYYAVFISDPQDYPGLHKSIDNYAAFAKFTFETLCKIDSGFLKWFEVKAKRIINKQD